MAENDAGWNLFPVGESSFANIIEGNGVYVDKTGLIHDLISGPWTSVPYFLSRPRRFGKTLLLDTIQLIFEGQRDLFSGLEIERRLGDRWDTFPVIRLSFSDTDPDKDDFEPSLLASIKREAMDNAIVIDAANPSTAIADLIRDLSRIHVSSWQKQGKDLRLLRRGNVVLLIDEYDFPLIGNIGFPERHDKIRLTLRKFYSSIKSCSNRLRFVFITGITKFRQLSLFSSMNTTEDISLDERFATICGFTKKDINTYFLKYFASTVSALKRKGQLNDDATPDDLLEKMMKWYNGYTWD
ncbi:MAG: AAA family ATPase, partial [Deltaproteobacteria bacterium]|nr:AAA family ATPase [Deltaproteobacteria bacterium]